MMENKFWTSGCLGHIGDTAASNDHPSSMGKTHVYVVSPYVGKVRLLMRD